MKRAALFGIAILIATWSCDEMPADPDLQTGWIYLEVVVNGSKPQSRGATSDPDTRAPTATSQEWDAIRVTVTGGDSYSWQVSRNPGDTVVTPALAPGEYTVMLEGLVSGEIDYFGITQGVTVVAGDTARATIQFSSFTTTPNDLTSPTTDVAFTVTFPAVANATGYLVELDTAATFPTPATLNVTQPTAGISVASADVFHMRVRAYNQWVSVGRPGGTAVVEVVVDTTGDSPAAAVDLGNRNAANGTYEGINILPPGDVDLFALHLLAGDYVSAQVHTSSLATPSELDPAIALLDAAENVVAEDNAAGEVGLDSILIAASGTYYLRVSARPGALVTDDPGTRAAMSPSAAAQTGAVGHYVLLIAVAVPPVPSVAYVNVSPDGAAIQGVGNTTSLTAQAYDASDNPLGGVSYTWSSLNPSVASVGLSGVATAVGSGQAVIGAEAGGAHGYAVVTVTVAGAAPVNLWNVVTPSPTSNMLWTMWGASAADIWAAGDAGTLVRYGGSAWTTVSTSPTSVSLWGMWGSASDDVWAMSSSFVHYDGSEWSLEWPAPVMNLHDAWGSAPDNIWVVGDSLVRYDGVSWSAVAPVPADLRAVWGTAASDVWAVGTNGVSLHHDGASWTQFTNPVNDVALLGIWGSASNDVWAVGGGSAIAHFDGAAWTAVAPPGAMDPALFDIWGIAADDIWAVGDFGTLIHYDGSTWTELSDSPTSALLRAVWGTASGDMWAVGENGVIVRGHRGAAVTVTPGTHTLTAIDETVQLSAAAADAGGNPISGVTFTWSSGNESVATVDANGLLTAVSEGTANISATAPGGASGIATVRVEIPVELVVVTPAGASVSGVGTTQQFSAEAYAGGNPLTGKTFTWTSLNPAVATVDPATGEVTAVAAGQAAIRAETGGVAGYGVMTVTTPGISAVNLWQQVDVGTTAHLWNVWAASSSAVFAAGEGVVVHYDGTSWTTTSLSGANSVWGTSDIDVFVGGFGRVYHFDGAGWTEMAGPTTRTIAGIWGSSPDDVFAVGELGTAWHYDGSAWTDMTAATGTSQTLNAVIGWSSTDVVAGGNGGETISFDGTNWTVLNSAPLTLTDMWGPSSSDVIGTGTTSANVRFNGTDWSSMSGSPIGGHGVWGANVTDVYIVGVGNTITRFDGAAFVVATVEGVSQLNAVCGVPGSHVYVVGTNGTVLRGYRGATVTATPSTRTLTAIDATVQLSVAAADDGGQTISGITFTWSSDNESVATVNGNGLVTAVSEGTANISATAIGGAVGVATITVQQAAATVSVAPAGVLMSTTDPTQVPFSVLAYDANGYAIPSPTPTWTSLNPNVATIGENTGEVTAVAAGQVTIQAEVGGIAAYALLTVASSGAPPVNLWVDEYGGSEIRFDRVWGWSPSHIYAAGASAIERFDGSEWAQIQESPSATDGLWGSSPSDIFAAYWRNVYHFDGSSWTTTTTSIGGLVSVWGSSPVDVYVLGSDVSGDFVHFDGSGWVAGATGATEQLYSIWGSSRNDVFAVGDQGTVVYYDGSSWSALTSNVSVYLGTAWGTSSTSVYAGGTGGIILHYDGTTWSTMSTLPLGNANSICGSADDDIFVTGPNQNVTQIYRYDGSGWDLSYETAAGVGASFNALWVAPNGDVIAVGTEAGTRGLIVRGYRGATVTVTPDPYMLTAIDQTVQLSAAASDAGSNPITGATFTWSSNNESVATVDATGLVTAVANGTANITATAPGGAAGRAVITVSQ